MVVGIAVAHAGAMVGFARLYPKATGSLWT